jgi:hypothetical protein
MSDQLSPPAMSSPSIPETETEKNDPSFHLFPTLPVELRLKIWKLNMAEAQIVISASTLKDDIYEDTYSAKIIKSSCRVPPNLHINHKSRVEALKCYKPVFAKRLGHPVFFDFSKDYLWLSGDTVRIRLDHFLDSSSLSKETVKESQLIRKELKNLIFTQSRVQLGFMQTEMQSAHKHVTDVTQHQDLCYATSTSLTPISNKEQNKLTAYV